MKKNIGVLDKVVRIILVVIIGILFYFGVIESELISYILIFVAGLFLISSLLNFCPFYLVFDLTTRKRNTETLDDD